MNYLSLNLHAISFVLCPSALGSSRNFNNSKLASCWPSLALLQCTCLKHGYLVLLTITISIVQVVIPIMKRIPSFWTNAHMCALLEISLSTKVKLFKVKSPCQCFTLLKYEQLKHNHGSYVCRFKGQQFAALLQPLSDFISLIRRCSFFFHSFIGCSSSDRQYKFVIQHTHTHTHTKKKKKQKT